MLRDYLMEQSVSGFIRNELTKQSRQPINSTVWYFVGLPLVLAISSFVTWGNIVFPGHALYMVIGTALAYLATWINQNRSSSYVSYQTIGLSVLFLTFSYIVLLAGSASLRLYYSRFFLMSSYFLNLAWFVLGMLIFQETSKKFLVITGGISDKLKDFSSSNRWHFLQSLSDVNSLNTFDAIVVDMHEHESPKLQKEIADASLRGIPIRHAASVYEEYSGRTSLEFLSHQGLYELVKEKFYYPVKRCWETLFIVGTSVITLPMAAFTAIAIKLDSRGPVLFKQERIGKDGVPFTLYKFRSMQEFSEENGARFAGKEDPRITRVGRFIRKYRIDELPQFWNVLVGDMSLIGPRPEQPQFVKFFVQEIPFYSYRHKVRPGITGWAQNKAYYADNVETTTEKLEYDLYYVKNINLSLDILIVYATIKTILTGFGSR